MAEKAEKAGGQPVLTARETELLTLALQCLKDPKGLQVSPHQMFSTHFAYLIFAPCRPS